ncbi:hypothetical protein A2415_05420 [candidate division WWE3 bacterium RIFOXYC1_FULL_39_7]|uniref:Uncharacterized protein n=2 Tax=Katanobacteria TaxID=422282 RepID=A0A1F4X9M8_UNCKA|nr:MAG: hypothetical protein A2415_05420 [candidate division WWE3 bacterium RIFOXYC1_FULL_39_7]OGC78415.1 MAG: hypothetical protein A2619_00940 [candidate division WWE3 bacterium RIFOXYD1_FULL_39_9]
MHASLIILGSVSLILSVYSIERIKRTPQECQFIIWWAFPLGAFVWEDLLVYGFLHAVLAFFPLFLGKPELWLTFFLIFWVVRSAGETLYQFLQQFILPKHHPHYIDPYLGPLRKIFGNISEQKCFILMQISMQSITVLSLIGLYLIHTGNI